MENKNNKIKLHFIDKSFLPLIIAAIISVGVVIIIYFQTQSILTERLRERLIAIASTATLVIDAKKIEKIHSVADLQSQELIETINKMKEIRKSNQDLKYSYIFRKTENKDVLSFVADADMLASEKELDSNMNHKIDEEEKPPVPGELYEISNLPILHEAFITPTAATTLGDDKWGTFMSGFAPIRNASGSVIATLGIDVEVKDFNSLVQATLVPFILLAVLLLMLLTIQTIALIRIWKSRLDILAETDRQKDELLSIVSHQLATPIASLKWYLEILLEKKITKEERNDSLITMSRVVTNLSDLVSMILDVSRIQLGKLKANKVKLNFFSLVDEIIELIELKSKEKEIKIITLFPVNKSEFAFDKRLTRIALENLLNNAVKYTPSKGKITLEVRRTKKEIFCSVSDNGCGIPLQDQEKIFQKLFRGRNVINIEGNGFGLFAAKGAVEAQGGKIWFKSNENIGTTFNFSIPIG